MWHPNDPAMPLPCEWCLGDGCEDCLQEPDIDETALADHDWHQGEPTRWGGLNAPS